MVIFLQKGVVPMVSKKLSPLIPPVQPVTRVGVRAARDQQQQQNSRQKQQKQRDGKSFKDTFEQEAWKYDLPAYQYQTKTGKRVGTPQRDDSLLGGYTNVGSMTMESARSYMQAKAAEDRKREKLQARQNLEFNPFSGLVEDDEPEFI